MRGNPAADQWYPTITLRKVFSTRARFSQLMLPTHFPPPVIVEIYEMSDDEDEKRTGDIKMSDVSSIKTDDFAARSILLPKQPCLHTKLATYEAMNAGRRQSFK
jgi:hypothetical protein